MRRIGQQIGEKTERRMRVADYWTDLIQDVRYTFRTLGRDPGFAAVSILILALAIGANIAVFSVVNTLLLRPLPFPSAHELVWIAPPPSGCGLSCATYSADAYEEFRAQSRAYQDVTGYEAFTTPDNLRLTGRGEPEPATGIEVIGNFFQVLGVQPAMGRLFTARRGSRHAPPVALLANAYWRRQFTADPAIVGKAIELNGTRRDGGGRAACELRLRRRVFSRREGRSFRPAQPGQAAQLGKHRHTARPSQARRHTGHRRSTTPSVLRQTFIST